MRSHGLIVFLLNSYRLLTKLLPEKYKNSLRIELHKRFCVNNFDSTFYDQKLIESMESNSPSGSAISDHICTIFSDVIVQNPTFIVELGTRGGESTKALVSAAYYCNATLLSIDLKERPKLKLTPDLRKLWKFVQSDDIEFGENHFVNWCKKNSINPTIDFLFIDSSHLYEHTLQEINTWFRFLSRNGAVLFHDTNMASEYRRINNSLNRGWDNNRGVIRAIEEYFGKNFNEGKNFVDIVNNWLLRNYAYSSGLILLKRLSKA